MDIIAYSKPNYTVLPLLADTLKDRNYCINVDDPVESMITNPDIDRAYKRLSGNGRVFGRSVIRQ